MPAPSGDRQTVADLHREFAAKLKEQIPQVRDARRVPEDSDERWHIFASFPQPEPLRGFEHAGGHPPQTISWKDCFQAV